MNSQHWSTLQRRRKTSTRANRSATIRRPAISFVARPLISGMLNGRGGHPSVTPTSFCRVAGLTVATCHAALHAALADARVFPPGAPSSPSVRHRDRDERQPRGRDQGEHYPSRLSSWANGEGATAGSSLSLT